MAFYTGKGDKGTTKVLDSKERFSKGSPLAEALGTLDELNSFTGFTRASLDELADVKVPRGTSSIALSKLLFDVQDTLFTVQAQLAGSDKKLSKTKVTTIENTINAIEKSLPPLNAFVIVGASRQGAMLDVARTLARRAERRVVEVNDAGMRKVPAPTLSYLNRLSSLFFALARFSTSESGASEEHPRYK